MKALLKILNEIYINQPTAALSISVTNRKNIILDANFGAENIERHTIAPTEKNTVPRRLYNKNPHSPNCYEYGFARIYRA